MNLIEKKTVLLLAPKFFGYEEEIKKELEQQGKKVIFFDERPRNDFITKTFIRLNIKWYILRKIEKYYNGIIEQILDKKIDYIFLISPETIDIKHINTIKETHNGIQIYTYFWDSIKNKKKALNYLEISDRYFSFDPSDVQINKKIQFLPLFYIKEYEDIASKEQENLYDLSFIGTVHSDRYLIIEKIKNQLRAEKIKCYFYFYSPSKILFFLQKMLKKEFKKIKWKDVAFKSINRKEILKIVESTKVVIDIQHPLQTGLTMRTLEMLGARKKILTTNKDIIKYDFYNDNNIYIFDRDHVVLNYDFFNKPYKKIESSIYSKYALRNWIRVIFNE